MFVNLATGLVVEVWLAMKAPCGILISPWKVAVLSLANVNASSLLPFNTVLNIKYLERILIEAKIINKAKLNILKKFRGEIKVKNE